MHFKKMSKTTAILLVIIGLLATAFGTILLEKQISAPGFIRDIIDFLA